MLRSIMRTVLIGSLLFTAAALAQPTMDSLWPNQDGLRWNYLYSVTTTDGLDFSSPAILQLEGTHTTAGGPAQILQAQHNPVPGPMKLDLPDLPPLLLGVWRARPDLRVAIEERYAGNKRDTGWWPLFLQDGYFRKTATHVEMWQDEWTHATWIHLEGEITVGNSFVFQLVPELATDIFLHGAVAEIDASVSTLAGSFNDAVKMEYLVDYGIQVATNEMGDPVGNIHSEIQGHVYFVPDVGPVAMLELYIPFVWIDCSPGDCPTEWQDQLGVILQTQTLSLSEMPLGSDNLSWGEMKTLYR